MILYVSSGLAMPSVIGDDLGTAQAALSQISTTQPKVVYQTTTTAAPDTVLSQAPAATQPLAKNGTITLTVAKAPNTVKVLRVVGDTQSAAIATLNGQGLNVSEVPTDHAQSHQRRPGRQAVPDLTHGRQEGIGRDDLLRRRARLQWPVERRKHRSRELQPREPGHRHHDEQHAGNHEHARSTTTTATTTTQLDRPAPDRGARRRPFVRA